MQGWAQQQKAGKKWVALQATEDRNQQGLCGEMEGEAVAVPSHAPFVPQPLTPAISRLGKGAEAEAPR